MSFYIEGKLISVFFIWEQACVFLLFYHSSVSSVSLAGKGAVFICLNVLYYILQLYTHTNTHTTSIQAYKSQEKLDMKACIFAGEELGVTEPPKILIEYPCIGKSILTPGALHLPLKWVQSEAQQKVFCSLFLLFYSYSERNDGCLALILFCSWLSRASIRDRCEINA